MCNVAGRPGSARGMAEDPGISRGVGIEIMARRSHPLDMSGVMHPKQSLVRGFVRLTPFPIRMAATEIARAGRDARGAFGVSGSAIIRATRVVKDDHLLDGVRLPDQMAVMVPITPDKKECEKRVHDC